MSVCHLIIPLFSVASVLACGGKAPAQAPAPSSRVEPSATAHGLPQDDARCRGRAADASVHQIDLEFQKPTRGPDSMQITWANSLHDSFEGGRTEQWEEIVFQGVDATGEPTPSAFTWRPSWTAHPPWRFLPISRCARLLPGSTRGRLRIELFRHVLASVD